MVINYIGTDTGIFPKLSMLALEYPEARFIRSETPGKAVFSVYSKGSDLIVIGDKITSGMRQSLKKTFLEEPGRFTLVSEDKHRIIIKNGSAKASEVADRLTKIIGG